MSECCCVCLVATESLECRCLAEPTRRCDRFVCSGCFEHWYRDGKFSKPTVCCGLPGVLLGGGGGGGDDDGNKNKKDKNIVWQDGTEDDHVETVDAEMTKEYFLMYCQNCPKCHTRCAKNGGCDHLTCRECDTVFCFSCGLLVHACICLIIEEHLYRDIARIVIARQKANIISGRNSSGSSSNFDSYREYIPNVLKNLLEDHMFDESCFNRKWLVRVLEIAKSFAVQPSRQVLTNIKNMSQNILAIYDMVFQVPFTSAVLEHGLKQQRKLFPKLNMAFITKSTSLAKHNVWTLTCAPQWWVKYGGGSNKIGKTLNGCWTEAQLVSNALRRTLYFYGWTSITLTPGFRCRVGVEIDWHEKHQIITHIEDSVRMMDPSTGTISSYGELSKNISIVPGKSRVEMDVVEYHKLLTAEPPGTLMDISICTVQAPRPGIVFEKTILMITVVREEDDSDEFIFHGANCKCVV